LRHSVVSKQVQWKMSPIAVTHCHTAVMPTGYKVICSVTFYDKNLLLSQKFKIV